MNQILQINHSHESLKHCWKMTRKDEWGWRLQENLLVQFDKLMISNVNALQTHLINEAHFTSVTAHSGKTKTAKLLSAQYYWSELLNDCSIFVINCWMCWQMHISRDKTSELLHSLSIRDRCWQHISFNFKSFSLNKKGFDNIFVVVDHFEKRVFSLSCQKTVTAAQAVQLYYEYIWRIYRVSETATSDWGSQFISAFMNKLCKLVRVKQKLSTAYHSQTDRSTEILNQYIDQQLHSFVNHFQNNWSDLLLTMNYTQAILTHESTDMSSYELKLEQTPHLHFHWKDHTQSFSTVREQLTREEAQTFTIRAHNTVK